MEAVSGPTVKREPVLAPPAAPLRRVLAAAVPAVPAALLVALWLLLAVEDGGYFPRAWYPAAIATVVLLAATAAGVQRIVPASQPVRVALGLLGAIVAWSYLSLAWADSRGDAFEAANELLLVLATAWCMAIQPAGARALVALGGAWSLGIAVICGVALADAVGAADPSAFFDQVTQRADEPTSYPNASAALAAMAMLPAFAIAAARGVPAPLRGLMLGVATFLAEYAMLPQTRGLAVGLAVGVPVLLLLSPDRIRLVLRLLVAGAFIAFAAPAVLDVGDAALARSGVPAALDDAFRLMVLTAFGAAVAGTLLALLDARVGPWQPSGETRRRMTAGAIAAAVAVGIIGAASLGPRAVDWAESTWSAKGPDSDRSRLLSLSPEERPDYARAAWDAFTEHPVAGVGVGNFGREYDARRTLEKHSRYTHNLTLRALSEGGVVGLLLLVGMLGALAWAVAAGRRARHRDARLAIAVALPIGAYVLGHAQLDWLEEFAALAAPAVGFAFGALALRSGADVELPWWERLRRRKGGLGAAVPRPVALTGGVAAVAFALAILVPPWLSVRYLERARDGRDVRQVREDLRRSGDLNPLAIAPVMGEGRLAIALDRPDEARAAYRRALDREESWLAYLQLALLDAQAGKWADAERRLEQASTLSANDVAIREARKLVLGRKRVDPAEFDRTVVERPLSAGGDIG